jgi:hypothetical protein
LLLKRGDELGRKGAADGEWDVVWLAMKERGLVRDEGGKEEEVVGERSGRWPAEDSFA